MCEYESAVRAAASEGTLAGHAALALHAEGCETCAAAALEAALARVGLPELNLESDEVRMGLMAAGLATPSERRITERNARATTEDDHLRRALTGPRPAQALTEEEVEMSREGGERNEQSVLINLDTLTRTALGPRAARPAAREADASGLIDLGALGMSSAKHGTTHAEAPTPVPMGVVTLPRARTVSRPFPTLAAAFAVLVVGGAGVWALQRTRAPEAATVAAAGGHAAAPASLAVFASAAASQAVVAASAPGSGVPGLEAPASGAPASGAPAVASAVPVENGETPRGTVRLASRPKPAGGGPAATAPATEAPRMVVAAATPAPRPARSGGTPDVDDILGALDGKGTAKPAGGAARPLAAGGADPLLAEQLTKPQILGVVKKNAGAISACKDRQPDATGTVMVTMQIEKSGRVAKASAKGPFAGTPVGSCVESTVRGMTFPQFSGDSMTINMPFAL